MYCQLIFVSLSLRALVALIILSLAGKKNECPHTKFSVDGESTVTSIATYLCLNLTVDIKCKQLEDPAVSGTTPSRDGRNTYEPYAGNLFRREAEVVSLGATSPPHSAH